MIKVGYCVAYDWELLRYSIPQVYKQADVICLSLDKHRRSWTGQPFSWDEEGFRKLIAGLDADSKIKIYEDDFYDPELLPMQNEVRQRNKIAQFLGAGGWHVQLDADEYFLDFERFTAFLKQYTSTRKVNINCPMLNLYRQVPEGMLWIRPAAFHQIEYFPIATRHPHYEHGRRNGYFNVLTDFPILHQSWARTEAEIWEKLNNWGHAKDFDVQKYFRLWKDAGAHNYKHYKNFHHLRGDAWPMLDLITGATTIGALLHPSRHNKFRLPITNADLWRANSLWLSRLRKAVTFMNRS